MIIFQLRLLFHVGLVLSEKSFIHFKSITYPLVFVVFIRFSLSIITIFQKIAWEKHFCVTIEAIPTNDQKIKKNGGWMMTKDLVLRILKWVRQHKALLFCLLERLDEDELEQNILSIPDEVFSKDLKMDIMDKGDPYLRDYNLRFEEGAIHVELSVNAKQLGIVDANYRFTVKEFIFKGNERKVTLAYQEDVRSQGNMLQSIALKALRLKGSYLEMLASGVEELSMVQVNGEEVFLNFNDIEQTKKIPPSVTLTYLRCESGKLTFNID